MTFTTASTEHRLALPDGRTIALTDRGPTDAPVVVLLHSSPGSRLLDPDPEATRAAGVRLLTVDRPGYGGSTALPATSTPTLAGAADDLAHALRALGVAAAGVAGWSAGGRVALGLAARHPDLVRAVALVGAPAPDDDVPWILDEHREALRAMRAAPEQALETMTRFLAAAADGAADGDLGDPVLMVTSGRGDEAVLADPAVRHRLEQMMGAAFAQGPAGVAADIVAANVPPPGYDVGAVGALVALFYAEQDTVTPPEHGDYWAARLAQTSTHVVTEAGHLLVVPAWSRVLHALG